MDARHAPPVHAAFAQWLPLWAHGCRASRVGVQACFVCTVKVAQRPQPAPLASVHWADSNTWPAQGLLQVAMRCRCAFERASTKPARARGVSDSWNTHGCILRGAAHFRNCKCMNEDCSRCKVHIAPL